MNSSQPPQQLKSVTVEGRINGIDVSSVNTIKDFKLVKEAGFEFVYIQSSRYSSTRELSFDRTLEAARNAGLRCGAYHFCSHDTDPVKQAEFFYKASGGLGSKPGELPPMVDWEFCTPSKYPSHPQHCVDWVEQNLVAVEGLWYPDNDNRILQRHPVLYSYPAYCGSHQPALAQKRSLGGYPLCYASYKSVRSADGKSWVLVPWLPTATQAPLHALPAPFSRWTLWQYSGDKGLRVPGIANDCDRQVFNGSSGDWAEFVGRRRPVDVVEGLVKEDEFARK